VKISRVSSILPISLWMLSCASLPALLQSEEPSAILFPRATLGTKDVEIAIEFEQVLKKRYDQPPPRGTSWFEVLEGSAPVLISAPHATTPTREGEAHQFADGGTGALARALHRLAGATVIYTTYKSPSDPNFSDDNAYKAKLEELLVSKKPVVVLDLHASHWNRPYDVDFGTMEGRSLLGQVSLLRRLSDELRVGGLANFSQDYFAASRNATVTKWVSTRGVPCIQLEISSTWTEICGDLNAHRFAQLLEALTRFVRSVGPGLNGA
jgi:hypothetical protein